MPEQTGYKNHFRTGAVWKHINANSRFVLLFLADNENHAVIARVDKITGKPDSLNVRTIHTDDLTISYDYVGFFEPFSVRFNPEISDISFYKRPGVINNVTGTPDNTTLSQLTNSETVTLVKS